MFYERENYVYLKQKGQTKQPHSYHDEFVIKSNSQKCPNNESE